MTIYTKQYIHCDTPDIVIWRAVSRLKENDHAVFNNSCEYFATWCKTGIFQNEQVKNTETFEIQTSVSSTVKASKLTEQQLTPIDSGIPYTELYSRLDLLNHYIDAASYIDELELPTQSATPHNLKRQLKLYKQKPNVVLTGGFDAGKSHMANALLGSKNLPVGYQPATRVITFIRHVKDRPEWFKENVLIFDEDFWLRDEKGKQVIDLLLLDDQERCQKYSIQAGSFNILQKYGVHGEYDDIAAHAAVVYIDSPLLRACNLIDLPGYSDQPDEVSKDVEKANSAALLADVLLYASPAKGHINGQDMIRLGTLLRILPAPENESNDFPTLGNFFIVATHADPSISDEQLIAISNKAAKRLYNNLNETALARRIEQTNRAITEADLRQRFFTFWSERPDRCQCLFRGFLHKPSKRGIKSFTPQRRQISPGNGKH